MYTKENELIGASQKGSGVRRAQVPRGVTTGVAIGLWSWEGGFWHVTGLISPPSRARSLSYSLCLLPPLPFTLARLLFRDQSVFLFNSNQQYAMICQSVY